MPLLRVTSSPRRVRLRWLKYWHPPCSGIVVQCSGCVRLRSAILTLSCRSCCCCCVCVCVCESVWGEGDQRWGSPARSEAAVL
jgi:hypothetical protein